MDADFPTGMIDDIAGFFRDVDPTLTPGQTVYPDVFNRPLFFPLQRQRETSAMMAIAQTANPKTVFEIGTDKGGGLYHWCKCLPSVERVIACEIRGTPYRYEFERAFPHIRFLWIEESSYDVSTVRRVECWIDAPIDILFIDGDKSMFDRDFYEYLPLMNPRGVVFMHDVNDRPPREAFDRIAADRRSEIIIDSTESQAAVARDRRKEPATTAYESWLRHWGGRSCGVGVIYLEGN